MSSALKQMLEQRKKNVLGAKTSSTNNNEFDLKNYFTTYLPDGVNSARKTIRIIGIEGVNPFVETRAHSAKIEGKWKTLFCPKHEDGEACPFCDVREELMSSNSEPQQKLAKDYNAKLVYVVKIIDREDEAHGPKFWRFKHNWNKEGAWDKIMPLIENYADLENDRCGITDNEIGCDLVLNIERNSKDVPVITNVMPLKSTPLSKDPEDIKAWVEDAKTWRSVYGVKDYAYLQVVVEGHTPVWDKEKKTYVSKEKIGMEADESEIEDPASELRMAPKPQSTEKLQAPVTNTESEEEEDDDLPF